MPPDKEEGESKALKSQLYGMSWQLQLDIIYRPDSTTLLTLIFGKCLTDRLANPQRAKSLTVP